MRILNFVNFHSFSLFTVAVCGLLVRCFAQSLINVWHLLRKQK